MSSSQVEPDAADSTSGVRQRQVNKNLDQLDGETQAVETPIERPSASDDEDALRKPAKTYGRTPEGTSKLFPSPTQNLPRERRLLRARELGGMN